MTSHNKNTRVNTYINERLFIAENIPLVKNKMEEIDKMSLFNLYNSRGFKDFNHVLQLMCSMGYIEVIKNFEGIPANFFDARTIDDLTGDYIERISWASKTDWGKVLDKLRKEKQETDNQVAAQRYSKIALGISVAAVLISIAAIVFK